MESDRPNLTTGRGRIINQQPIEETCCESQEIRLGLRQTPLTPKMEARCPSANQDIHNE